MIPISQGGNPSSLPATESVDWALLPFAAVGTGNDVDGVAVVVVVKAEAAPPEGAVELVGTSVEPEVGMSELGRLVGGDDDVSTSLWPADGETVVVGLDAVQIEEGGVCLWYDHQPCLQPERWALRLAVVPPGQIQPVHDASTDRDRDHHAQYLHDLLVEPFALSVLDDRDRGVYCRRPGLDQMQRCWKGQPDERPSLSVW